MTVNQNLKQDVRFSPRRLGHGNLFVGELERSAQFYNKVCGLREVYREPPIHAAFLSTGTSHHDIALMQVSELARVGRQGHIQVPQGRGEIPGLNHLAWEMENEALLVEAYSRAKAAKIHINRTADHQVSHSVYLFDPDGNLHEFYSDAADDWKTIFRPDTTELVTGPWNPGGTPPSTKPKYVAQPEALTVPEAIFHPKSIGHCAISTMNFEAMLEFSVEVAGLTVSHLDEKKTFAVLHGTTTTQDLVLLRNSGNSPVGLHHIGFKLENEEQLVSGINRLKTEGYDIGMEIDRPSLKSVFITDPDGITVEFYIENPSTALNLNDVEIQCGTYLV